MSTLRRIPAAPLLAFAVALALLLGAAWALLRGPAATYGGDIEMRLDAAGRAGRWVPFDGMALARHRGTFGLRAIVDLPWRTADAPLGIVLSVRAAFAVAWDGVPLGANGVPAASAAAERPGRIDWLAPLPAAQATPGTHRVTVEASHWSTAPQARHADVWIMVAPLDRLVAWQARAWILPALVTGCTLVAAIYVLLVMQRMGRGSGGTLLLALCAIGIALPIVESWRSLAGYTYPWHLARLHAIRVLTAALAIALPWYLWMRFALPMHGRWWRAARWSWVVLIAGITLGVGASDVATIALHLVALVAGIAIVTAAMQRRSTPGDRDAPFVLVALGAALAAALRAPYAYADGLYTVALAALLCLVLLGHADALRTRAVQADALAASRERLRATLLRQSIHPHWLMNTLTSLQELLERDPPQASRMLSLLGDEFRLVRRASDRALVPLADEIARCRTHLAIVGLAHRRTLDLVLDDPQRLADDASVMIPPGVLHTIVENALTHGAVHALTTRDRTSGTEGSPLVTLAVRATGAELSLRTDVPARDGAAARTIVPGTGTRFVQASLEDAFPGRWRFNHGATATHWSTELVFPRTRAEVACAS
ncbi:MAG: histidine kinase [Gemmatimonadaceae bacterium]|jgi:hypothetical protein|nr:histidine kinase [Gemmatimonadaceae bacterium]